MPLFCRLLLLSLLFSAFPLSASPLVRVAAASDLRSVLPELIEAFSQGREHLPVSPSFAASGKLATQIEQGAPFDLYLSADESYAQRVADSGRAAAPPQRYVRGGLLLWVAAAQPTIVTLEHLPDRLQGRLAIANPRHAPYGQRAREALQQVGSWEPLSGRIVYGENVAQAAQLALSGAASACLVAQSLRAELPASGQFLSIDPRLYAPLWQAGVVIKGSRHAAAAERLLQFLRSPDGQRIFAAHGFLPLQDAP